MSKLEKVEEKEDLAAKLSKLTAEFFILQTYIADLKIQYLKLEDDRILFRQLYGDIQTRIQHLEHPNMDPVLKAFQKLRESVK